MNVTAYREGLKYEIHFEKGNPVGELIKTPLSEEEKDKTGTFIEFKPDIEVFEETIVSREYFVDTLRRQAMLIPGVRFELNYEGTPELAFEYQHGIVEYVQNRVEDDKNCIILDSSTEKKGNDGREGKDDYVVKMQVAMTISRKHQFVELYHNSSNLEYGGVHMKAMRTALTKAFTNAMKESNEFKKDDSKIIYKDIEDVLVCVISTSCPGYITDYENQTKKAITNKFVGEVVADQLEHMIKEWTYTNPEQANVVLKEININRQTRESAEMTRQKVMKKLKGGTNTAEERPEKFVDCDTNIVEERELYIVEGDSALGSCKSARNAKFQAIMPVRGKTLNCLKADIMRIFQSDIILDLIKVIGCGVEVENKHIKEIAAFDISKLRYGKIIICTDADVDGYQIRTLLLTMIYRLMPTLLEEGYVYIVESPLYEIMCKKGKEKKVEFAYTDEERDELVAKLEIEGWKIEKINRSKGLGENDPEMMHYTTMSPDTRRLIKIDYELTEELITTFNALLGDDIEGRRERIQEYAQENDYYTIAD